MFHLPLENTAKLSLTYLKWIACSPWKKTEFIVHKRLKCYFLARLRYFNPESETCAGKQVLHKLCLKTRQWHYQAKTTYRCSSALLYLSGFLGLHKTKQSNPMENINKLKLNTWKIKSLYILKTCLFTRFFNSTHCHIFYHLTSLESLRIPNNKFLKCSESILKYNAIALQPYLPKMVIIQQEDPDKSFRLLKGRTAGNKVLLEDMKVFMLQVNLFRSCETGGNFQEEEKNQTTS